MDVDINAHVGKECHSKRTPSKCWSTRDRNGDRCEWSGMKTRSEGGMCVSSNDIVGAGSSGSSNDINVHRDYERHQSSHHNNSSVGTSTNLEIRFSSGDTTNININLESTVSELLSFVGGSKVVFYGSYLTNTSNSLRSYGITIGDRLDVVR